MDTYEIIKNCYDKGFPPNRLQQVWVDLWFVWKPQMFSFTLRPSTTSQVANTAGSRFIEGDFLSFSSQSFRLNQYCRHYLNSQDHQHWSYLHVHHLYDIFGTNTISIHFQHHTNQASTKVTFKFGWISTLPLWRAHQIYNLNCLQVSVYEAALNMLCLINWCLAIIIFMMMIIFTMIIIIIIMMIMMMMIIIIRMIMMIMICMMPLRLWRLVLGWWQRRNPVSSGYEEIN